jgi:hypothetical protein
MMAEQYYIQRKQSQYLGNAPVWYAKEGRGYTSYIQGAERFSEEDAERMIKEDSGNWAMWSCTEVNKRLHLVFDIQDKRRLGTDDPCGWHFGYAPNPDNLNLAEQQRNALLEELKNIAECDMSKWAAEFKNPADFKLWAQNRARLAIANAEAA